MNKFSLPYLGYRPGASGLNLCLICYLNNERIRIPLKIKIPKGEYRDRKYIGQDQEIKAKIKSSIARLTQILIEIRDQRRVAKAEVKRRFSPNNMGEFISFMSIEMKERFAMGVISAATFKAEKVTLSKWMKFAPNLSFSEMTAKKVKAFDEWHLQQLMSKKKPVNQGRGTRFNANKHTKVYTRLAVKKGKLKKCPYKDFSFPKPSGRIVFLEREEIQLLEQHYWDPNCHNTRLLSAFLFSCYTGMSFGDVANLKQEQIEQDRIIYYRRKTANSKRSLKPIYIPLIEPARRLIDHQKFESQYIFDLTSNQVMNRCLKRIMAIVGIKKVVTFHVARHTFATLFLRSGGAIDVLQRLLDHSSIEMTMNYVHLSQGLATGQMESLSGFLELFPRNS